jgi:O-antigen ligase
MELWQYVPHNSILGMLGFTGFLGVLGYWMMFPTAILFLARTARLSRDPDCRAAGLIGVMSTIAVMNQMFGDMGIFSWVNMYMMSMIWGLALRIPIEGGVWPGGRPAVAPQPAPAAPQPGPVAPPPGAPQPTVEA